MIQYLCHVINFFVRTTSIHRFPYSGPKVNLKARCKRCGCKKGETKEWRDYCKMHDMCVKRGYF